jgi:hypothetical protein
MQSSVGALETAKHRNPYSSRITFTSSQDVSNIWIAHGLHLDCTWIAHGLHFRDVLLFSVAVNFLLPYHALIFIFCVMESKILSINLL